ncbi:hypothetical protein J6590_040607 [Homalodisca vitripennis]|nr:hypothetical protein J6590_040607 [Homalodisca vitripennis]
MRSLARHSRALFSWVHSVYLHLENIHTTTNQVRSSEHSMKLNFVNLPLYTQHLLRAMEASLTLAPRITYLWPPPSCRRRTIFLAHVAFTYTPSIGIM